jgi:hypothetical protein
LADIGIASRFREQQKNADIRLTGVRNAAFATLAGHSAGALLHSLAGAVSGSNFFKFIGVQKGCCDSAPLDLSKPDTG